MAGLEPGTGQVLGTPGRLPPRRVGGCRGQCFSLLSGLPLGLNSVFDKVKGNFRGNKFHAKGELDGGETGLHMRFVFFVIAKNNIAKSVTIHL